MVGSLQRHLQHSNASKQVDQPRGNSHAQHQKRDAPLQRQNAVRDEGQRCSQQNHQHCSRRERGRHPAERVAIALRPHIARFRQLLGSRPVPCARTASGTEGLDDGDALHHLHRSGGNLHHRFVEPLVERTEIPHHERPRNAYHHDEVRHQKKGEANVHREQVHQGDQGREQRGGHVDRRMPDRLMQVENVIGGSLLHLRRAVVVEPSQRNLPQVLYQHGAHVNAKIGVGVMAAAGGHAEQHPPRRRTRDGDQNPHRQHVGRGNAFRDGQLGNARDCEVGDELTRRRQGRDGDVAYDPPFHRLDQTQIRAPSGGTVDRFHKRHSFLSRKQGRRRGKPADVQMLAIANFKK